MILIGAAFAAPQELTVEVLTEPRSWSPSLTAVLHRPDGDVVVPLVADPARGGFFVGRAEGAPVRFLDLEVRADAQTAWRRIVPIEREDQARVSLLLEGESATRVAWLPWSGGGASAGDTVALAVAFGWGGLCAGYVGWLARTAPPSPRPRGGRGGPPEISSGTRPR